MRHIIFLLALAISPVLCHAQSKQHTAPVKGINLAWLNGCYGHDFGHNPQHPDWGFEYTRGKMEQAFQDIERMQMSVVRIFVFEDLEGLQFDEKGYVSGVDPVLIRNFSETLELAEIYHLKLYFALGSNFQNRTRELRKKDIIGDPKARRAYLSNAVNPFINSLKGKKAVFAIDVHNEPEVEGFQGPPGSGYPWPVLASYIRDAVNTVHRADSARKVSVGGFTRIVDAAHVRKYRGLGLDFYDFHLYSSDAELPPARELGLELPVLIGEFNGNNNRFTDEAITSAVKKILPKVRDGGYLGALYWDYGNVNGKWVDPRGVQLQALRPGGEWRPFAYVLRDFDLSPKKKPKRPIVTPHKK